MTENIRDDGGREFVDDPRTGRTLGNYFTELFSSSSPTGIQEATTLVAG